MARSLAKYMARGLDKPVDTYSGRWMGRDVVFERVFRGHRFTDEECQALCDGELIEIYDLQDEHGLLYGVKGALRESVIQPGKIVFKSFDFLINKPYYDFQTRERVYYDDQKRMYQSSVVDLNNDRTPMTDLVTGMLDDISDSEDAKLAAILAGDLTQPKPVLEQVEYLVNEKLPVFVPTLPGVGTFTKDGLEEPLENYVVPFVFMGLVDENGEPVFESDVVSDPQDFVNEPVKRVIKDVSNDMGENRIDDTDLIIKKTDDQAFDPSSNNELFEDLLSGDVLDNTNVDINTDPNIFDARSVVNTDYLEDDLADQDPDDFDDGWDENLINDEL